MSNAIETVTDIDAVLAEIAKAIPEATMITVNRCLLPANAYNTTPHFSWGATITVFARGKRGQVLTRPESLNSRADTLAELTAVTVGYYRYHTTGKL